jgi:ribosomal protein L3 glutamine methyltransferase
MRSAERRASSPVTLRTLLRDATRRLEAARLSYGHGTRNARDEAAWLVLHALRLPLEDATPYLDRTLSPSDVQQAEVLIRERIRSRKPAAYLTHEAWLGDHAFYIDERAIVPRSYIAELLRQPSALLMHPSRPVRQVLDLCTGSGCLAILAALAFPRAHVDGADISRPALEVAKQNVAHYGLSGRVSLTRSDLFSKLPERRYDLILSNPPYVRDAVMRRLPTEYTREPALALAGGRDGLDFVRRIVAEAPNHLNPQGVLVVEVGHNRKHVERAFPRLPFVWPDTSGGDDCVFVVTRETLVVLPKPARARPANRAVVSPRPQARRSPARASAGAAARRGRSARGSGGSR